MIAPGKATSGEGRCGLFLVGVKEREWGSEGTTKMTQQHQNTIFSPCIFSFG
jgi:hypothetical protein